MKLSHFGFELPEELLAEYPAEHRDESRLMVLNRKEQTIEHKAEKKELGKVQVYLDLLPTKDEVVQLRGHMKSSIEKFTIENRDFTSEFHAHLAIIRRYDEVLSDKASKHSVV